MTYLDDIKEYKRCHLQGWGREGYTFRGRIWVLAWLDPSSLVGKNTIKRVKEPIRLEMG
jgi:hypothetical protein